VSDSPNGLVGSGPDPPLFPFSSEKLLLKSAPQMARARSTTSNNDSANIGFEAKLWLAADKLRNNMDAALREIIGQNRANTT